MDEDTRIAMSWMLLKFEWGISYLNLDYFFSFCFEQGHVFLLRLENSNFYWDSKTRSSDIKGVRYPLANLDLRDITWLFQLFFVRSV